MVAVRAAAFGPASPVRHAYRSPPATPQRGPRTDWATTNGAKPPSPPRVRLYERRPHRNVVGAAVVALACAIMMATPEHHPPRATPIVEPPVVDLSQPPSPVPRPVYHLTHALRDMKAAALALPLRTQPPTPERHVVGKGASTVTWSLDPWLVRAAVGTLITADIYVEHRLFATRTVDVETQRVAVDFGSLPDGVHSLSVVLKSASTLPRFAPQTLRATLTATRC
jgi:hypothetical protein